MRVVPAPAFQSTADDDDGDEFPLGCSAMTGLTAVSDALQLILDYCAYAEVYTLQYIHLLRFILQGRAV